MDHPVDRCRTPQAALPVELPAFGVKACNPDRVCIYRTTASAYDNDYFTVERSPDGRSRESLLKVAGRNGKEAQQYIAEDVQPLPGWSYYRLKQTDYNGSVACFAAQAVIREQPTALHILLYPNRAIDRIYPEGEIPAGEWKLFDVVGRRVRAGGGQTAGKDPVSLELSSLLPGIYRLHMGSRTYLIQKR